MKRVLVIFKSTLTDKEIKKLQPRLSQSEVVVAPMGVRHLFSNEIPQWVDLEGLVGPGSIYEATAFAEELSLLTLPNGTRITKAFTYEGYELWWIYYNKLFLNYCLPYTQNKKLLEHLKGFDEVHLYKPWSKELFIDYLQGYGRHVKIFDDLTVKITAYLPLGVLFQVLITIASLPVLLLQRKKMMIFTSDFFEKTGNFDFRMKFIYKELEERTIPFVELIRSVESWKTVLQHALVRKRPVIYTEAISFVGHLLGRLQRGRSVIRESLGIQDIPAEDSEARFKFLLATHFLQTVNGDVWAIRISKWIFKVIGIKSAYITAALDRNFHAVLGCKLNNIPTVGILHGYASKNYNLYDFLPTYDGKKRLSVDRYGVWSDWWKNYYLKYGKAYKEDQLHISGPMRPLMKSSEVSRISEERSSQIRVLFVSEQLAFPEEVLPYLKVLMETEGMSVHMVFRPYADGFEGWLKKHHPEILNQIGEERIFRNGIKDALPKGDVVVGSHSTAVIEGLLEQKPIVLFASQKWGDYFELKDHPSQLYAEDPASFVEFVKEAPRIPVGVLEELKEQFFGDPNQNGSKWVVDELISSIK